MGSVINGYNKTPIFIKLAIGMAIGALLAIYCPKPFMWIDGLGITFVNILKYIGPLMVFVFMINAIVSSNIGRENTFGLKRVTLMFVSSLFAASVFSIICWFVWKIGVDPNDGVTPLKQVELPPQKNIFTALLGEIAYNPVKALIDGKYLSIVMWAIAFGLLFRKAEHSTQMLVKDTANAITKIVRFFIALAPFGVMGLMFHDIVAGKSEANLFYYPHLIIMFLVVFLVMFLVINPIIVYLFTRQNAFKILPKLEESIIYSLFTASSAANIAVNQKAAEENNVSRQLSSVAIPLGATLHKPGSVITLNILTLVAASGCGVNIGFTDILCLGLVSIVASMCVAGVANGTQLIIPICCGIFGLSDSVIIHIIGVNAIITIIRDTVCTTVNSSSDLMFVLAVDQRHKSRTSSLVDNIINSKRRSDGEKESADGENEGSDGEKDGNENERRSTNEDVIKQALSQRNNQPPAAEKQ
ncbi:cation:dicarboxylate symporter family transporter [Succinimonas amylolytica]|uniref:cation:dicarboxylate symporter family transporter n=1 Tax=Succinimonas amylolytica TaxID=83769 RepID=UPI0023A8C1C5